MTDGYFAYFFKITVGMPNINHSAFLTYGIFYNSLGITVLLRIFFINLIGKRRRLANFVIELYRISISDNNITPL